MRNVVAGYKLMLCRGFGFVSSSVGLGESREEYSG